MIRVVATSPEDRDAVVDKALSEGHHAIVTSSAGILVIADKALAAEIFQRLSSALAIELGVEGLVLYAATDNKNRDCISAAAETPASMLLYGVDNDYFVERLRVSRDKKPPKGLH